MSIFQRRGIISLIPKGENYLVELTNWRPITLLSVDYKILARAFAKRVELRLPNLIHSDQTGFIKGRFIGQNVRLLNDIMVYTELNKIPGIMVLEPLTEKTWGQGCVIFGEGKTKSVMAKLFYFE